MADPTGEKKTVRLHYLKSPFFRVVHADGAYGGLTPNGNIHIAFYSERQPIPQQVTHVVNPDGTLGDEVERVGRDGHVREVEVDVMMGLVDAKALRAWLDDKIVALEAAFAKHGLTTTPRGIEVKGEGAD